jgi:hypothetical protein
MGVADAVQAGEPLHLGLRVPLDADEIAGAAANDQGLDGDGVDRQAVAHEARKGRIGLRPNERLGVPPEGRVKAFRLQDQPVPGDDRKPVEARAGRAQAGGVELQGFQGVHEFSETLVDHAPELCRLPLGRVLIGALARPHDRGENDGERRRKQDRRRPDEPEQQGTVRLALEERDARHAFPKAEWPPDNLKALY